VHSVVHSMVDIVILAFEVTCFMFVVVKMNFISSINIQGGIIMKDLAADRIRNVCLMAHGGAGKTTLAEAMLYNTGVLERFGRVEDGTTTSDYDPEEIKRKSSISTSICPCQWKDHKINVIDTPGYFDFVGEVKQGIRVADVP